MAASGRISVSVTGKYGNISGYIDWSESDINTSANTSRVTATLYYANRSGYTTYSDVASPAFYLTINGNTKSTSSGITVSAYSNGVKAISHSVTVTHNDNGSKSITISGGGGLSGTSDLQNSSGSGTAILTSIVRGKPTATLTVSPYSLNSVISGWGVYVKGLSQISYTISGTPYSGSGATIASYEFDGNKEVYTTATGRTTGIRTAGSQTVKGWVKDSRGIWSNAASKDIEVYDYADPKITSASAYRSDSQGTETANGTHIAISCSAEVGAKIGNRNSIASIRYTIRNNDSGTVVASGTLSNGVKSVVDNIETDSSYFVQIVVKDTVNVTTVRTITVSKSITTFHLAENGLGVGIGTECNQTNALTINPDWNLYAGNKLSDYIVEQGTSGNWTYRKWKSGIAEAWGTFSVSLSQDGVSGGDYYSRTITISTPFKVANAIVTGTAENRYSLINPDGSYANQNISFRLKRGSAISESSIGVQIHVCGYWKV